MGEFFEQLWTAIKVVACVMALIVVSFLGIITVGESSTGSYSTPSMAIPTVLPSNQVQPQQPIHVEIGDLAENAQLNVQIGGSNVIQEVAPTPVPPSPTPVPPTPVRPKPAPAAALAARSNASTGESGISSGLSCLLWPVGFLLLIGILWSVFRFGMPAVADEFSSRTLLILALVVAVMICGIFSAIWISASPSEGGSTATFSTATGSIPPVPASSQEESSWPSSSTIACIFGIIAVIVAIMAVRSNIANTAGGIAQTLGGIPERILKFSVVVLAAIVILMSMILFKVG